MYSDEQIQSQISTLNDDYTSVGLSFTLANTTRTTNATWFSAAGPGSDEQTAMKTALRQGGMADLNVYTVGFESGSGEGLLGYSTFPWDYSSSSRAPVQAQFSRD